MDFPICVVAPSHQWFVSWCQDNNHNPKDQRQVRYITRLDQIQGLYLNSEMQIVDLGPFDPKRYELVLALVHRIRKDLDGAK